MRLSWLDPVRPDPRELAGLVALLDAVRAVDSPHQPPPTVAGQAGYLRHGWEGDPPLVGVGTDAAGRVVGTAQLVLPRRDNRHMAHFDVVVDPLLRRRGLGRRLLGEVVERSRAEGRRTLVADSWTRSPGADFLAAHGFEQVYLETQRQQDVREVDQDRLAAEHRAAEERAAGYTLLALAGATPAELLPAVAVLTAAINDAPTGSLDVEPEVYSQDRVSAFERAQHGQARRLHRLVARETASGELAGQTMVAVDAERPGWAMQLDTSVLAAHRGHRLGLLLKTAMLRHLATAEPQLRAITTWNADSNAHMLRVNEALGYRVLATASSWQRAL